MKSSSNTGHYEFLMNSAHEFQIIDQSYMLKLILDHSFKLIKASLRENLIYPNTKQFKEPFKDLLKSYLVTIANLISSNEKRNSKSS
jgi:hypothetical protein